ncbi:DUF3293 domain-containing protein [Vibrio hepatarius]|uniref:DUF3293 domain-containing protein n=1 Tax=Vibrio hepatarius TaxID=171383 RepID=UPI001C08A71B|nr:DUF3293 domain-containing protein [Vibrio hepatarius]MBU2897222.1 DUF3293 domain-containing protein [Vibrio hepatarius]
MAIDKFLWQQYSDPYFTFVHPLVFEEFAILTAWNPYSQWQSKVENDRSNHSLVEEFGHTYFSEVYVGDRNFSWVETSFAVVISEQHALYLGQKYKQNAIYYVINDELYLLSCLADQTKVYLGSYLQRCR